MSAADVTVEVTFKKATYTISAVVGEGGSATIKPTKAQYGDTVTVTATPSKGYALDTIKVNGKAISGDTFTMPAQNTEVDVSFKKLTYKINVAKPVNGSVSVSATTATYGEKITVTATPATGYAVNTIKVNDTTLTGNTFNMSAADVTVEVTFKKVQYTVTVKYSAGGTATADVAKAGYGDMVSLTLKPNTGYEVEYVTVNDENSEQVFTMPAENVTVYVKFKKKATKEQLVEALKNFSGKPQELNLPSAPKQFIQYLEEDNRPQVALDVDYERGMGVSVGRLREDTVYDWKFIGLAHNTVRGAAGGAVLCAELLKAEGYIDKK